MYKYLKEKKHEEEEEGGSINSFSGGYLKTGAYIKLEMHIPPPLLSNIFSPNEINYKEENIFSLCSLFNPWFFSILSQLGEKYTPLDEDEDEDETC